MSALDVLAYLNSQPEDWRRKLASLYSQGASDREVMVEMKLSLADWKTLEADSRASDFAELVETGRLYAHAWWEQQGRINLNNPKFNVALWKANMSNRFGWSDKSETSLTNIDFTNMDDQALMREIKRLKERLYDKLETAV